MLECPMPLPRQPCAAALGGSLKILPGDRQKRSIRPPLWHETNLGAVATGLFSIVTY
jgi:hypothetical protein